MSDPCTFCTYYVYDDDAEDYVCLVDADEDLFEEFTRDENGNVVLSREDAEQKVKKLGGCDKLYRLKLEADYLAELTYIGAAKLYGDPLPEHVRERINFELHVMKTMGFPGYFLIVGRRPVLRWPIVWVSRR